MNAQLAPSSEHPQHAQALLRTLVITDLCDSTALVERLGDQRTAELIREHDRLLRGLIRRHRGQEVDKTDGFLSLFERPIQAVAFALDYQRDLQAFAREHGVALKARIGIHVGEVMTWQNHSDDVADGAKPMEVEGLAKPVAARLMGLALPGQILLSSVAYTLAHRAEGELGATLSRLKWKHHGRFRFKGVAEAVPVYEIGEPDIAPFRSPAWTGKAHREVPLWRRPVSLALEGLMLLALVALPLWHFLKPEPAIAFAERDWVVLGDLRNLTGDARFDDSLEQAFRIGLEQSRYVNVLSETALSRALETMKRDPRTVNVNREIGAELAIREGASALLLPSIAEVGGRLRFTIEVIDPASQATVFSVARDASDSSAIVDRIDESLAELRGSLGESINAIADTHTPLSSAATANLDALKAYSIGVSELVRGRPDEALAFYRQALRLDANFTMARIGLSDALRDLNRRDEALAELRTANDAAEDLLERERLHLDAKLASLAGKPEEALSHWGVLSRLYPDFYPGQGGLAWYAWTFALDNNTALDAARAGSVTTNPHRGAAVYLRGILQLSLNQADSALVSFEEAASLGSGFSRHFHSAAYASKLRFDEAEHVLSLGKDDGTASAQLGDLRHRVLLALDQGEFSSARRYSRAGSEIFNNASLRAGQMWANQQISVSFLMDDDDTFEKNVRQKIESELAQQSSPADPEATADRLRGLLLTGILCTFRNCNPEPVSRLWATLETEASNSAFLDVRLLTGFLRMELELDRALLRDQIHNFSKETTRRQAIWIDLALARAYLREGQTDRAIDLFESLPGKRGLAWTEMRGDFAMQTFCVLATSLSYLDLSQALHSEGKTERARDALNQFVGRWPAFGESDFLAERVSMISENLQTEPGQGSETSANLIERPVSQGPQ